MFSFLQYVTTNSSFFAAVDVSAFHHILLRPDQEFKCYEFNILSIINIFVNFKGPQTLKM